MDWAERRDEPPASAGFVPEESGIEPPPAATVGACAAVGRSCLRAPDDKSSRQECTSELLERVAKDQEAVIVERGGVPQAVVMSIAGYKRLQAREEASRDLVMEAVFALPIEFEEGTERLHRRAVLVADRLSLPAAYVAHYLALADALDVEL